MDQNAVSVDSERVEDKLCEKGPNQKRTGRVKSEIWRTLKFALFSLSAGIIQMGATALFVEVFKMDADHGLYWVSYVIALVLSVLWNFTFNRKFTFKSAKNVPIAMMWVFVYYLIFTPCSVFWQEAWLKLDGWRELELVVTLITVLINGITEFLWQRLFIYRKSINTNAAALKKAAEAEAAAVAEASVSEATSSETVD